MLKIPRELITCPRPPQVGQVRVCEPASAPVHQQGQRAFLLFRPFGIKAHRLQLFAPEFIFRDVLVVFQVRFEIGRSFAEQLVRLIFFSSPAYKVAWFGWALPV